MRRKKIVSCEVSYIGTDYHGFAQQKKLATVEAALTRAFSKIIKTPVKLMVAGRTDRGVHAVGQVVSFCARLPRMSEEQFTRAANSWLPENIRVVGTTFHQSAFDARRSARCRVYLYQVLNGPENIFYRPYAHQVATPLNLARMRRAAAVLVGQHNFAVFGTTGSDFKTTVRRVIKIKIEVKKIREGLFLFGDKVKEGRLFQFIIEANAFLYRMCRNIVGFLLAVGMGKIPLLAARQILKTTKGIFKFRPAPARGLFLLKINY